MKKKILLGLMCITVTIGLVGEYDGGKVGLSDNAQAIQGESCNGRSGLTLGREYYRSLLLDAARKHWVLSSTFFCDLTYNAFPCIGNCGTLASYLFPKTGASIGDDQTIRIRDIFILSRISDDNKVKIEPSLLDNVAVQALERPASSNQSFGAFRSDQYIALLANTKLQIHAEQKACGADLTGAYQGDVWCTRNLVGVIGVNIPIKSIERKLDIRLCEGSLFRETFSGSSTAGTTPRSTALKQFFRDFVDIEDFFKRAVLEPKGLTYEPHQRKTGFGDMSLFTYLDAAGYYTWLDALHFGLNFSVPTGLKANCKRLWEVECSSGAYQFSGFFNTIFNTCFDAFNPTFYFSGEVSAEFTGRRRIPQLVTFESAGRFLPNSNEPPNDLDLNLVVPINTFRRYASKPFSELDSLVPLFASKEVSARIKYGSRFNVGFGNYFYNVCHPGVRLGLFYDYTHKNCDKICVVCEDDPQSFDTASLTKCSETRSHRFGWNLTHQFRNLFEVSIGSQHVVAGCNAPQTHEAFFSIVFVC